ncbi:MAG: hypothetical protein ABFE07_28280 [Armatimonadia bacterium]
MDQKPIEEFVNEPREVKAALVVIDALDSLQRKGFINKGPVRSTPEGAEMAAKLRREGFKVSPDEVLKSLKVFRVPEELWEPFSTLVREQLDGKI